MSAKKILIIDDEESIHYIFKRMFDDSYQLFCAKSLKEAKIKTFVAQGIDLAITDIFLKGETGLELVQDIRNFGQNVPIIIMSAYADAVTEKTIEDMQKQFSCFFIRKPFENKDIFALVNKALKET